jgi:hypothetical protein
VAAKALLLALLLLLFLLLLLAVVVSAAMTQAGSSRPSKLCLRMNSLAASIAAALSAAPKRENS